MRVKQVKKYVKQVSIPNFQCRIYIFHTDMHARPNKKLHFFYIVLSDKALEKNLVAKFWKIWYYTYTRYLLMYLHFSDFE